MTSEIVYSAYLCTYVQVQVHALLGQLILRAHTLLCHFSADAIIGDLLDISSTSVYYNKQQHVHQPWDTSVVKTLTACSLQCSTIDLMCIYTLGPNKDAAVIHTYMHSRHIHSG